ncbi:MAG: hypothetical protein QXN16_03845, partial [Candidatus Micrarchaeaceae archaeon]
ERLSYGDWLTIVALGIAFSLIPGTTFIPLFGLVLGTACALAIGFAMVYVVVFVFGSTITKNEVAKKQRRLSEAGVVK